MFNVDASVQAQIARKLKRVLVIDPDFMTGNLLVDLLKGLGADERQHASTTTRALEVCAAFAPQLIMVELNGPEMDGVEFTVRLRRSKMACRKAPVIMLSADSRARSILMARDAGAHEFLCKPFTAGALFKRVENVTLKPRPWIEARMYVGPDRRRFNSGEFDGGQKRAADAQAAPVAPTEAAA